MSIRTITIDEIVVNLQDHKHEQDEIKNGNAPFYHDEGFIFANNEGSPRLVRHVGYRMERLLKMTKIKKHVTPHSFRHTHTSLLIEAGVECQH